MDYAKIGLMVGLELHQQLEGKKLFCSCPTLMRDDEPDIKVKRFLRASAGESGKVDVAAKLEQLKKQHFLYEVYSDTNCLVELDEEPPHNINTEALNVTLQLSKMLGCRIFNNIHVMRKTVVDGSNTSGFQRTALVAVNGKINNINIQTVCLEEDAAKIIGKEKDFTVYRLDRLGIPLIEIATGPDIRTPEEAKEVAEKIGMMLRSTGKAKRGIGTIRQDVNISIKGGARTEIKGAQELKLIPLYVEYEALRQEKLIELSKTLKKFKKVHYENSIVDVSDIFKNTNCKFVKSGLEKSDSLVAMKVDNFKGIVGMELVPNFRVGSELAGYAKTRGFGGLIHSDEDMKKYNFSEEELKKLNSKLGMKNDDAFIMILGNKVKAFALLNELIAPRIRQFFEGMGEEVRNAQPDGTSVFLRPVPGASRMYPETDVPVVCISDDYIKNIEIPELIQDISERYIKLGLGKDLAKFLAKSDKVDLFDGILKKCKNVKPAFIAETLLPTLKEIERTNKVDTSKITDADFIELFEKIDREEISKESVIPILVDICNGKKDYSKYKLMSDGEIENILKNIVEENKNLPFNALIGKAMSVLRGKANGQKIVEMLKKLV